MIMDKDIIKQLQYLVKTEEARNRLLTTQNRLLSEILVEMRGSNAQDNKVVISDQFGIADADGEYVSIIKDGFTERKKLCSDKCSLLKPYILNKTFHTGEE